MRFRAVRFIDQVLGRALLLILAPLCHLFGWLAPRSSRPQPIFCFLKLHGGGSLLIALPSLLGIRKQHPEAEFVLVCTTETQKYAELTGLFDRYILVQPRSFPTLALSGLKALGRAFRCDVCVDLEPHSFLAAVFTALTLGGRRLGFVKANELYRAGAYTEALFFNPHAPIYAFYDQMAGLFDAKPAAVEECRQRFEAQAQGSGPSALPPNAQRPVLYLAPFCSDFAPERMMPNELWVRLLNERAKNQPMTILLGGAPADFDKGEALKLTLNRELPLAQVLNLCGARSLMQGIEDIRAADAFWGINSGPLHIARFLGKPCRSFWGPTNPFHRLRVVPGLEEETVYLGFACSPCIDSVEESPCRGNNLCMKLLLDPPPATPPILMKFARRDRA